MSKDAQAEKNLGLESHDITVARASALEDPAEFIHRGEKAGVNNISAVDYSDNVPDDPTDINRKKKKWWAVFLEPGSAPQIIVAALLAVAIGMAVNATTDKVPVEAIEIVGIPGRMWLRALTAVGE